MRNLLLAGTAGLLLAFAAAGASADTLYYPDGSAEYVPGERPVYVAPQPLVEGRAAYVEQGPTGVTVRPILRSHYYDRYRAFPFANAPVELVTARGSRSAIRAGESNLPALSF